MYLPVFTLDMKSGTVVSEPSWMSFPRKTFENEVHITSQEQAELIMT